MTLNEFFKKLEKTPRRWKLGHIWRGEQAITDQWDRCPIASLGGEKLSYATRLNMRHATTMRVIHAADKSTKHSDYDTKLRARLLKACGIDD